MAAGQEGAFPAQPAPAGGEKGGAGWSSEPGKIMGPCAKIMSCLWGTAAWVVGWCDWLLEVIGPCAMTSPEDSGEGAVVPVGVPSWRLAIQAFLSSRGRRVEVSPYLGCFLYTSGIFGFWLYLLW